MALATTYDVVDALGRPLATGEDVTTMLEQASDLVIGYLGAVPTNPVPPAVVRVVASMVAAVLTKPATTTADYVATGYNTSREQAAVRVGVESATTTGPWLSQSLKMRLEPYRTTVFSIQLGSEVSP
jgi:hypothetical protein